MQNETVFFTLKPEVDVYSSRPYKVSVELNENVTEELKKRLETISDERNIRLLLSESHGAELSDADDCTDFTGKSDYSLGSVINGYVIALTNRNTIATQTAKIHELLNSFIVKEAYRLDELKAEKETLSLTGNTI